MTILELADHIEQLDDSPTSTLGFDMLKAWVSREHSGHPCGTACCIGGHANALLGGKFRGATMDALVALTGIPDQAASLICYPDSYKHPNPYHSSPKQAARLLRHYAETGEVDWAFAMATED